MNRCSVSYILFVITVIAFLFTVRQDAIASLILERLPYFVWVLVHGLPIVLFFHLIGKLAGLSLGSRMVVDTLFPVAGYTVWEWL